MNTTKDGLPREAFDYVGDPDDPETWKFPHHTKSHWRYFNGRLDLQATVDWDLMRKAVAALAEATDEEIWGAAYHLASHYREADRPMPDALADFLEIPF